MSIMMSERKADKSLYKEDSNNYIPVSCQYDRHTVLMKDGHCAQTIRIVGVESEDISEEIATVRASIKASLSMHLDDRHLACWIHTIRRAIDMDDRSMYPSQFAIDLNKAWIEKNNLHNKYVNALYITVVHIGKKLSLQNIDDVSNMSASQTVASTHKAYIDDAVVRLTTAVDNIIKDLSSFNPQKLGIRYDNEMCYNDALFIYKRVLGLRRQFVPLTIGDFSIALASSKYAVGSNKIEVVENGEKRFGAILSVREYNNANNDKLLDSIMELPIEFVATEIFYSLDPRTARKDYNYQKYILDVSRDSELLAMKGLTGLMNNERSRGFCNQQISITVIADEVDRLESHVTKISKNLATLGLVNVREDINLENIFWSHLPGNFKYIRRAIGNTMDHIGVFASLEDKPLGAKKTKIGPEVCVLSTISNTPYFFNFHHARNVGHTVIYGNLHSGKSVLVNFLMTYATKYNPTVLFLNTNNSAEILLDMLGGKWASEAKLPIYVNDEGLTLSLLLDVMSGKYLKNISQEEQAILDKLIEEVSSCQSFMEGVQVLNSFEFPSSCASLKASISPLLKYLEGASIGVEPGNITGINCIIEGKELEGDLKAAFVLGALRSMCFDPSQPKFLILDEATYFLDHPYFEHNIDLFLNIAESYNISILSLVDTDKYITMKERILWKRMKERLDLEIIMFHKKISYSLAEACGLTEEEEKHLLSSEDRRCCILKPKGSPSVILQMNINSLVGRAQIFSPSPEVGEKYKKFVTSFNGAQETFLPELYKALGEK